MVPKHCHDRLTGMLQDYLQCPLLRLLPWCSLSSATNMARISHCCAPCHNKALGKKGGLTMVKLGTVALIQYCISCPHAI